MNFFDSPSNNDETRLAQEFADSLFSGSNSMITSHVERFVSFLKGTWMPEGTTTAKILEAMGSRAAQAFELSSITVTYYWSNASLRSVFIAVCERLGFPVAIDANGEPIFSAIQLVDIHQDGTVTLRES